jgi:hypothetical protein
MKIDICLVSNDGIKIYFSKTEVTVMKTLRNMMEDCENIIENIHLENILSSTLNIIKLFISEFLCENFTNSSKIDQFFNRNEDNICCLANAANFLQCSILKHEICNYIRENMLKDKFHNKFQLN